MSSPFFAKRRRCSARRRHQYHLRGIQSLEGRQLLAAGGLTYVVSTTTDDDDGDHSPGELSLREAIGLANNDQQDSCIEFDEAISGGTILLGGGELEIDADLVIQGPGSSQLTIDAGGQSRVFLVQAGVEATIAGLTVTGGQRPQEFLADDDQTNSGGAILNLGALTIEESLLFGNSAQHGGAIQSSGQLTIRTSTLRHNRSARGGAVDASGPVTVIDSTFGHNRAQQDAGGAIHALAILEVDGSTFVNNFAAGNGGGLAVHDGVGSNTIFNSTFFGNAADVSGGAIAAVLSGIPPSPITTITNSTIVGNIAGVSGSVASTFSGGGISITSQSSSDGLLEINNTIIADNTYAPTGVASEIAYAFESTPRTGRLIGAHNLIGNEASSADFADGTDGNIVGDGGSGTIEMTTVLFDANRDGQIGERDLLDYSGPTKTFAPALDSVIVDAGDNALAIDAQDSPLILDQREQPRRRDGDLDGTSTVDIGAYEDPVPLIVNTIFDFIDPLDNLTTLREAMGSLSQVSSGDDRIRFSPALSGNTISLSGSPLLMEGQLFIDASNLDSLTIDANGQSRIFSTDIDDVLTVAGLTLARGSENDSAADAGGASIRNLGRLNVVQSRVTASTAAGSTAGAIWNASDARVHILSSQIDQNDGGNLSGGGFFNRGTATVVDSTFDANTSGSEDGGGAIFNDAGVLIVESSLFTDNEATEGAGGGIYSQDGKVVVSDTTLEDNTADTRGGGLASSADESLTVEDSQFIGNRAQKGGGINGSSTTTTITNSTLTGNTAEGISQGFGGGINLEFGSAQIKDSMLDGNIAHDGGAIYTEGTNLTVLASTLSSNTVTGSGGGIYNLAGDVDVINSTISSNTAARFGGGIRTSEGPLLVTNSTVVLNHADSDGAAGDLGGGVYVETNNVQLNNTLVAGNRRGTQPIADDIGFSEFERSQANLNVAADHSLISDAATAFGLTDGENGNIIGVPGSLDQIADLLGPLRDRGGPTKMHGLLKQAADAGQNELATDGSAPLLFDQRGEGFRRINGNQVDIGAYESGRLQNLAQPLDANKDLKVSALDALLVINYLATVVQIDPDSQEPIPEPEFFLDIDGSDTISSLDALIIINRLGIPQPVLSARLLQDTTRDGQQNRDFVTSRYALEFGISGGVGGEQLEVRIDGLGNQPFTLVGELVPQTPLRLDQEEIDTIIGGLLGEGEHRFEIRLVGETATESFLIAVDRVTPFDNSHEDLDVLFADRVFLGKLV